MSRTIMLIPTGTGSGLTSVSLGLIRAMERKGVRLSFFKPVAQPRDSNDTTDLTTAIVRTHSRLPVAEPLTIAHAESLLSQQKKAILLEELVARYHENTHHADIVLIEGLVPTRKHPFATSLNKEIANALNAEIILVLPQGSDNADELKARIELARNSLGTNKGASIIGAIVNKINAPVDEQGRARPDLSRIFDDATEANVVNLDIKRLKTIGTLPLLGAIPWHFDLISTRVSDIVSHLQATAIHTGDRHTRRIKSIVFCARSVPLMLQYFRPGALLVTSADRPEVIIAACLAAMNGVEIGALLLTGGGHIPSSIHTLCERAFATGLPVYLVQSNTWQTSLELQSYQPAVPIDDYERIERVGDYMANYIDPDWIDTLSAATEHTRRLSPPAFRYQLTEMARRAGKRIVLPEGDEPRTIKAAAICAERGIAHCILLGEPENILHIAASQGVSLGDGITIIDPHAVRERYVPRLVALRKNKGMTDIIAREQLEDNVVLGTLMLEQDEVDGLVSGAVHTTANTIRPPLQLIKTAPESALVSSIFFMLLPEQVLVYGDCAINPDPTAEQLAEIAIQSADSAALFGIEPRVAMISYSTGNSGSGSDVEKVKEATRLAQVKRPDLIIDGPLQYDAAIMADVARAKAPDSRVAGKATVFIFPDLNTGNTTYKAVQRSADLISIGPMLQGMRKPVNDLSRGALVDDIVYTIALTAIQGAQTPH
ncbi:phosphate acetyltransferase [Pectobacterium sp. B2J-2]|uniref:phosphate acetyltransferase n=1 Tax=Pectobacterium sp. B2J-2 TaxID=3385372 RepID=UPI0038FC44D2